MRETETDREKEKESEGRDGMQTGGKIAMGDAKLLAWMLRWENARTRKSHSTRERERGRETRNDRSTTIMFFRVVWLDFHSSGAALLSAPATMPLLGSLGHGQKRLGSTFLQPPHKRPTPSTTNSLARPIRPCSSTPPSRPCSKPPSSPRSTQSSMRLSPRLLVRPCSTRTPSDSAPTSSLDSKRSGGRTTRKGAVGISPGRSWSTFGQTGSTSTCGSKTRATRSSACSFSWEPRPKAGRS